MLVSVGGLLKRASIRQRSGEMMWVIASLPFFVSGVILALLGLFAPLNRKPAETDRDIMEQLFFGLLFGGILLVFAAKIAS